VLNCGEIENLCLVKKKNTLEGRNLMINMKKFCKKYPDSSLPTKLCVEGKQKWHGMGSFDSKLISTNLSADTRDPVRHPSKNDESKKSLWYLSQICSPAVMLYSVVFTRLKLGYHLLTASPSVLRALYENCLHK